MCSARRVRPPSLRRRLTLWTGLVVALSLGAGFAWVHHGLARVLESRNDEFLERKAAELLASVGSEGGPWGGRAALDAEIVREVAAYEGEGLAIAVREPGQSPVAPGEEAGGPALRLAALPARPGVPATVRPEAAGPRYRVLATRPGPRGLALTLAISLEATEATLAAFDRRAAGGAAAFLALAVLGGVFLSRQALRPVAESIAAARRIDPRDLAERLPRTGSGDEIDELAGTVNGLLDRLAAYHAQVIRFTADASHELRSPLAAMRAAVEVALQRPRAAEGYRDVLASLGEQCEQLTALVNGLLLLARADAGEVAVARDPVDLAALAGEAAEMYEPLAEDRGIAFRWECPGPVAVAGDAHRLRQLVTNLVDNAIKFTPRGGSVLLRVGQARDAALLSVEDTGAGIEPVHLPHIFDRFYRADAARTAASGSGLGLSICRWIAEAHGGRIAARSTHGAGSTFAVELPLHAPTPA